MDLQVLPVPMLGMMSMKQLAFLMGAFFASYMLYNAGSIIFIPLVVAPALYFSFVPGKTYSPLATFINWIAFIVRNSNATGKPKTVVKSTKPVKEKKKFGFLNVKH